MEVIMIGDQVKKDIQIGKNIGAKTILFCTHPPGHKESNINPDCLPDAFALSHSHLTTVLDHINSEKFEWKIIEDFNWETENLQNTNEIRLIPQSKAEIFKIS